jgi:hypothetical protein
LELHDAECWRKADGGRLAPSAGRAGKSVIAFSLWGRHAAYNYGALINLALAPKVYPGWICRFYVGADVPQAVVDRLLSAGAEVVPFTVFPDVPTLFARFLPLADPTGALFLSHDCDRLNETEPAAVAAWELLHVVRDTCCHKADHGSSGVGAPTAAGGHVAGQRRGFPAASMADQQCWPSRCGC